MIGIKIDNIGSNYESEKDFIVEMSIKEFVTSIQGKDLQEVNTSAWSIFGLKIIEALDLKKCKELMVEIYAPGLKTAVANNGRAPFLRSPLYEVCVLVNGYNQVIRFNGLDCTNEHLDEVLKKQLNKAWRKLLANLYGIKDEIVRDLKERKDNQIKEINNNFNTDVEGL